MTYTTQQLQVMSDFEVNKALANKLRVFWHAAPAVTKNNTWEYAPHYAECKTESGEVAVHLPDYCNNHNDIMPLAFERGIKLDCVACPAGSGFVYYAKSYDGELQSDYDSACRAIACLILMMED